MKTPQRAGLIHAFFGERAVSKVPEAKLSPREVVQVGVIGGAPWALESQPHALWRVSRWCLLRLPRRSSTKGSSAIHKNLKGALKRGKLAEDKFDATKADLKGALELTPLDQVDLVIEAVFENMVVKKDIFVELDKVCKPGTILASNTSYLDLDEIAGTTSRPKDVIGLHVFSPAHVMRLLEIVVGAKTDQRVTATGFALAKRLRKIGVKSGVCDGFIGNRILTHYRKTAAYLVLDGASPQEVDHALEEFGFAMGPHKVGDLAGLDIDWMTRQRKALTRRKEERYYGKVADRICEKGWFGRKSGKGY